MFLEGVINQLEVFAAAAGVEPREIFVRLVLRDGESVTFRGLQVTTPFASSDWGMLRASGASIDEATVVREDDILRIQLQRIAPQGRIGFPLE